MIGSSSNSTWQLCFQTNTTYLDCPIAKYDGKKEVYSMYVAIHNPSNIKLSIAEIQVPHGHYQVSAFNATSQSW
jgi:hypothetical protein